MKIPGTGTAKIKILMAAGGSGGHIFPCVSLITELEKAGVENMLVVSSKRRLDRELVKPLRYPRFFLSVNPMPLSFSLPAWIVFLYKCISDLMRSLILILKEKPDVIVGFGGYSSGAVALASKILRVPLLIHEQNSFPGRANMILSRFADRIALSFTDSVSRFGKQSHKTVFTGNPIRVDMLTCNRESSAARLGILPGVKTVLIMGGSQGARFLNRTLLEVALKIKNQRQSEIQFIHITGRGNDHELISELYRKNAIPGKVFSFLDRIDDAYSASDIVVSRAGAAAIFELAYYGRPMILIPYPAAKNSQRSNALFFASRGAAVCHEEKDLSQEALTRDILEILNRTELYAQMREEAFKLALPHAGRILAEEVIMLSGKSSKK